MPADPSVQVVRGQGYKNDRHDKGSVAPGAGTFGLTIFLTSLSVLFLAGIVAYVIVRGRAEVWPPQGTPPLPLGVWLSTLLLIAISAAIQLGVAAIRKGEESKLRLYLSATLVGAILFAACQVLNWFQFYGADESFYESLYGFGFFMLTGLHAGHVLGGVVAMIVVSIRAWLGHYNWAYYPGVQYMAIYWHFLAVAWIVILAVLLVS